MACLWYDARMAERRWYRLHPLTWLVKWSLVLIVGATLSWLQFQPSGWGVFISMTGSESTSRFGWPVECLNSEETVSGARATRGDVSHKLEWTTSALVLNAITCLVLVWSTWSVTTTWTAMPNPLQIAIAKALAATAIIGMLLVVVTQRESVYSFLMDRGLTPGKALEDTPIASVPVLFALACTIWASISLATHVIGRLWSVLSSWRSPPASPSAP